MATNKHIYWRDDLPRNAEGERSANVHLLIGYNQCSITDFLGMADMLRETFPRMTNDEIQCGRVNRSVRYMGFSIVTWSGYLPADEYPGWIQWLDKNDWEYYW